MPRATLHRPAVGVCLQRAGQRVEKPGKLYWRGAGSDALAETDASDTIQTIYIFFGGKRIARLDSGMTKPKYYVEDNVGSTALVTDYLGNRLSESLFFPYGGEQQVLTGDANTYKFTCKERDPESGLDDFGARYYASNLGRFMSPDWDAKPTAVPYASFGDPQTLNLYAYVENAPLNRVDADGHAGLADSSLANNWEAMPKSESPDALAAWHRYCLGSGWFPVKVLETVADQTRLKCLTPRKSRCGRPKWTPPLRPNSSRVSHKISRANGQQRHRPPGTILRMPISPKEPVVQGTGE